MFLWGVEKTSGVKMVAVSKVTHFHVLFFFVDLIFVLITYLWTFCQMRTVLNVFNDLFTLLRDTLIRNLLNNDLVYTKNCYL